MGGWGQEIKLKAGLAGDKQGKSPPTDSGTARSAGDQPGKPPAGRMVRYPAPVPPGFSPRGCKGRSPLHEITLILPLPAGKGGGWMGAGKKTKGRASRRQRKQATPVDSGTARSAGDQPGKPPNGHLLGKFCKCRRRFNAGVPGAKPPSPPLPHQNSKKPPPAKRAGAEPPRTERLLRKRRLHQHSYVSFQCFYFRATAAAAALSRTATAPAPIAEEHPPLSPAAVVDSALVPVAETAVLSGSLWDSGATVVTTAVL